MPQFLWKIRGGLETGAKKPWRPVYWDFLRSLPAKVWAWYQRNPAGAGREGVTGDVARGDVGCALLHGTVDRR